MSIKASSAIPTEYFEFAIDYVISKRKKGFRATWWSIFTIFTIRKNYGKICENSRKFKKTKIYMNVANFH